MWITHQMNKKDFSYPEVYGGYNGEYDVVGQSSIKQIPYVFPFGFYSMPKKPRELVFIKNQRDLCLGTVPKEDMNIKKGEVQIYNDYGAFITLLSDGSVNINGLVIDKNGKIITPSGGNT